MAHIQGVIDSFSGSKSQAVDLIDTGCFSCSIVRPAYSGLVCCGKLHCPSQCLADANYAIYLTEYLYIQLGMLSAKTVQYEAVVSAEMSSQFALKKLEEMLIYWIKHWTIQYTHTHNSDMSFAKHKRTFVSLFLLSLSATCQY